MASPLKVQRMMAMVMTSPKVHAPPPQRPGPHVPGHAVVCARGSGRDALRTFGAPNFSHTTPG
eukprot:5226008-Pyramimonas_sp.AAC.1